MKPTSLRFFWHLLRPNWSIIRDTVSLWRMLEHRQIARCFWRKMPSISEFFQMFKDLPCLKKNDQLGRKRFQRKRKDVGYQLTSKRVFSKIFCFTWTCQKFVHYIRILGTGCFILNGIVLYILHNITWIIRFCLLFAVEEPFCLCYPIISCSR